MDFILYGIVFVMGVLVRHLLFTDPPGQFEATLWTNLRAGKQVIVSIDSDAYIFELHDNRLRITRATAELIPVEDYGLDQLVSDDLAGNGSSESDSSDDSVH